jgi:lantibiotic biosynthesis protein
LTKDPYNFLSTAVDIGNAICCEALWWGDRCTWFTDDIEGEDSAVVLKTCGPSLYSGTAGIALFLARLYALTSDRIYAETAQAAITQAWLQPDTLNGVPLNGLYSGRAGVAYASTVVGQSLSNEKFILSGIQMFREITEIDESEWTQTDVTHGGAGAIVAALSLYRRFSEPQLLDWAHRMGREIVKRALKEEIGWSWPEIDNVPGLNGFSHGAAGYAWALGELAWVSGDKEFVHAAQEATRYEQYWFNPEVANWPDFFPEDFKGSSHEYEYSHSWCHGAPGICLSRLKLWERFGNANHKQEAEIALQTTTEDLLTALNNKTGNFCLCHGLAGNAESLICAYQILGREDAFEIAHKLGVSGIEQFSNSDKRWPCGIGVSNGQSPSLMLGWAGTGYYYLRLYDPQLIPSVLLLDC